MSSKLLQQLRNLVGANQVITDPLTMQPWLTEPRGLFTGQAMAVVRP